MTSEIRPIALVSSGPSSFIAGASIEARINDRISIEANVLHRPMNATFTFTIYPEEGSPQTQRFTNRLTRAWEFPLLFKYTLGEPNFARNFRPFLALGPPFRTQEDASGSQPSRFGFSAGVGVTTNVGRFRVSPTIRYTRWAREDIYPRYETKPDQLELLASFSYETKPSSRKIGGRQLHIGFLAGLSKKR